MEIQCQKCGDFVNIDDDSDEIKPENFTCLICGIKEKIKKVINS